MKKIKYLVLALVMLLPLGFVKAEDNEIFPSELLANDGAITYEYTSMGYVAYLEATVSEVKINIPSVEGYTVFGPSQFVVSGGETIVYYNFHNNSVEGDPITIPVISYVNVDSDYSGLDLVDLQVVGYELKFNPEVKKYEVTVPSDVDTVYVYAETTGVDVQTSGDGIIDLKSKKTTVAVESYADGLGSETYEIVITKKNDNVIYYIIIALLIVLGIAAFVVSKIVNKKTVNKDELKSIDINKTDVSNIIKPVQTVNTESTSENLITPRTMMAPEETKEVQENK